MGADVVVEKGTNNGNWVVEEEDDTREIDLEKNEKSLAMISALIPT